MSRRCDSDPDLDRVSIVSGLMVLLYSRGWIWTQYMGGGVVALYRSAYGLKVDKCGLLIATRQVQGIG